MQRKNIQVIKNFSKQKYKSYRPKLFYLLPRLKTAVRLYFLIDSYSKDAKAMSKVLVAELDPLGILMQREFQPNIYQTQGHSKGKA